MKRWIASNVWRRRAAQLMRAVLFFIYTQLLFTVYTVDKTQVSVQLQQNTKAIYSTSINEQFETNLW